MKENLKNALLYLDFFKNNQNLLNQKAHLIFSDLLQLLKQRETSFFLQALATFDLEKIAKAQKAAAACFVREALPLLEPKDADEFREVLNFNDTVLKIAGSEPASVLKLQLIADSNAAFERLLILTDRIFQKPPAEFSLKLEYFNLLRASLGWKNNSFLEKKQKLFLNFLKHFQFGFTPPKNKKESLNLIKTSGSICRKTLSLCQAELKTREQAYRLTSEDWQLIKTLIDAWLAPLPFIFGSLNDVASGQTAALDPVSINLLNETQNYLANLLHFYMLWKIHGSDLAEDLESVRKPLFETFYNHLIFLILPQPQTRDLKIFNAINYAFLLKIWALALHGKWQELSGKDFEHFTFHLFQELSRYFCFPCEASFLQRLFHSPSDFSHLSDLEVSSFYCCLLSSTEGTEKDKEIDLLDFLQTDLADQADLSQVITAPFIAPQMILWKITNDLFLEKLPLESICLKLHDALKPKYEICVEEKKRLLEQ
jgi:hypothetical protein